MSKLSSFILIDIILVIISGIIVFKDFRTFGRTIYWLMFPNIISIWSKKVLRKDIDNSIRADYFILLSAFLIGLNYLIFKFLL
jgi:hypothetical protein